MYIKNTNSRKTRCSPTELTAFSDRHEEFAKLNTEVCISHKNSAASQLVFGNEEFAPIVYPVMSRYLRLSAGLQAQAQTKVKPTYSFSKL